VKQKVVEMNKNEKQATKYIAEFSLDKINPRKKQTRIYSKETDKVLQKMIEEFGFVEPIILDKEYNIVHGQHRYLIAKKMKLETVPVIIANKVSNDDGTTGLYGLLADRMVEWNKWEYPTTDSILKKVDGGLKKEKILDFETTSEKGDWRETAKTIGWYIQIIPKNLSASNVTLDRLAGLLTKQLAGKYQFDDAQLLFIEALREELEEVRAERIRRGELDGGAEEKLSRHRREESSLLEAGEKIAKKEGKKFLEEDINEAGETVRKFSAEKEFKYLINEQAKLDATAQKQITKPSDMVFKDAADGKMMSLPTFVMFATTFGNKTKEEATKYYNGSLVGEFNKYCREIIDKNPKVDPDKSNKVSNNIEESVDPKDGAN